MRYIHLMSISKNFYMIALESLGWKKENVNNFV